MDPLLVAGFGEFPEYKEDLIFFKRNKTFVSLQASNSMMTNVQKGLEIAIDNVSTFLEGQVDGTAAGQVHQAALNFLS